LQPGKSKPKLSIVTITPRVANLDKQHVSIAVFVIATNNYLAFAEDLIRSANVHIQKDVHLRFVLLTDDVERAQQCISTSMNCEVVVRPIAPLGWPDATLMRFELMINNWDLVEHDLVAYMDADMKFVSKFGFSELSEPLASTVDIALVSHPGYFRRNFVYRFLLRTSLGPWEHRRSSSAFVPMRLRKTYVCGGMFWGRTEGVFDMIKPLALSVRQDKENEVYARHNDESHLNQWLNVHQDRCSVLPPRWVFDPTYRHLRDLSPIVEAVRKPKDFKRILSS